MINKERSAAYSVDLKDQIRQNSSFKQNFLKDEDEGAQRHINKQTAWLVKNEADKSTSRDRLIKNTMVT